MLMKPFKLVSLMLLLSILVFCASNISAQPHDALAWQTGPFPPANFQYARHDGAFVPGPALATWANKVYFPGGRTSPPTESPDIWRFDPVTQTYSDTGANVVEDVSNYNANLVMDDGTGRGPAIYIIGGTNKDGGGINIGLVQRYYPKTNEAEALPAGDYWNGMVNGQRVACVGSAVVDDLIYVFGGWETNVAPYFSSDTWRFNPKAPSGARWTNLGVAMHTPRSYIMSAVQGGLIYAIGGVSFYDGNDLGPSATFEVLDPANLAAGWSLLPPMPTAGGEGRGFGFDADTLQVDSTEQGLIYVVAPNDWPAVSGLVYAYDIANSTWITDLPSLPTPRADLAGSYVPLCTSTVNDGLPGIWTFGGRVNESCDPPLGPTEYTDVPCEMACEPLTSITPQGPVVVAAGDTVTYTATITPEEASAPVYVTWNNGDTTPVATYSWPEPGSYTVEINANNCDGTAVVTGTLSVEVYQLCTAIESVEISGPTTVWLGEDAVYTANFTPPGVTPPVNILWSNGVTVTQSTYAWNVLGPQTVSVVASNCGGPQLSDTLDVEVIWGIRPMWMPIMMKP
jgi:hypothetical protein